MRTTVDSAGRLVIPREIRREAGIEAGTPLEVTVRDGHIEIAPVPLPVKLVRKGRFVVAEPQVPVPALSAKTVERTREALRRERDPKRPR